MSNLIHKITDKLHGGSDTTTTDGTTTRSGLDDARTGTTSTHGTTGTTGSRVDEARDTLTERTGTHSTTGTHGTTGSRVDEARDTLTGKTGVRDPTGSHSATEEAPVVKERIHEHTDHIDKTKREDLHEKTNIVQTVQPIVDEQHEGTKTRIEDRGTEVHEHGRSGIDEKTALELQRRREEVQAQQGTTYDHTESERRERPDVRHTEKTNTIEQVVPVVERDVYKEEVVEHKGKEVHIHHDAPTLEGTRVAPAITIDQYKRQEP